jgi:hypothetical protein
VKYFFVSWCENNNNDFLFTLVGGKTWLGKLGFIKWENESPQIFILL